MNRHLRNIPAALVALFLLTILSSPASAAVSQNDSLAAYRVFRLQPGKSKVDSLLKAITTYRKTINVEPLLKEAGKLINNYSYHEAKAQWFDLYGVFKRDRSAYPDALELHKKALKLAQEWNNTKVEISALNNLGVVYRRLDESALALKYHLEALKLSEKTKDDYSASIALNSIGNIHVLLGHNQEAITYFRQCLPIAKRAKNDLGIAMNLNNIGEAYENLNMLDSAKHYYTESLHYNQHINVKKGTAIGYNSLGNVYKKEGRISEAIVLYRQALAINIALGDKIYVAGNYINIGNAHVVEKQYAEAEKMLQKGLQIALSIQSKAEVRNAAFGLMQLNENRQKYKEAFYFSKLYKLYADSIVNEKNSRNVAQMEAIYEKDKEQQKIVFLEKAQKDNRLLTIAVVILLALSLIVGSLSLIRHRLRLRNKQLQRELEVRYQIAADLHDDLGSTLSSISILSSVLTQHCNNQNPSSEIIQKIFENAQNALKAIDDIIWSVNPKNNKFANLFVRIKEYAIPLFESKKIDSEISIPETANDLPLSLEVGRNSYLIIKEAINNLAKHSQCTRAKIIVTEKHPYIDVEIMDNGIGFDWQKESSRNGIKNMEERAKQINAQFSIISNQQEGTSIHLRLKPY
jgi:signal transduction histidine kinase